MASIQQSLNQLIGSVSGIAAAGTYLYSQSEGYHKKQQLKDIVKKQEVLSAQEAEAQSATRRATEATLRREGQEVDSEEARRLVSEGERAGQVIEDVQEGRAELAAQAFELDPTAERYEEMREAERAVESREATKERIESIISAHQSRKEQAEQDALERVKIRAQILGITEEQLRARESMLRKREDSKGGKS